MSVEIERKFLVTKSITDILKVTPANRVLQVEQRYLQDTGDWTIRIRRTCIGKKTEYWLTLKQKITNIRCVEIENPITSEFYYELAKQCSLPLTKTRHEIETVGHLWEVDCFTHPVFEGLIIAEIELENEHESFVKPSWLGKEVTTDKEYKNARMIRRIKS